MGFRADRWLLAIGLAVWLFVGVPTLVGFARQPGLLTAHGAAWLAAYLSFAFGFWLGTGRGALSARRAALALQTAAALGLLLIGMPEFEGALLAVVAAQTPLLFSLPLAGVWTVAQAVPLFWVILPSHGPFGALQAVGAYLAFGGFAVGAAYLQQRENRARLALGRLNAELLATRHLLADSSRLSERLRISRDLHDALGHHLIALGLQLEREPQRAGDTPGPIAEAKAIVRHMLADVRAVVGDLRADGGLDVGQAIELLAAAIPEPRIHLDLPPGLDPVDPAQAQALFRCVQEGITNAIKHGDAGNLWIRIARAGDSIELRLKDDGRGVAQVKLGNGLAGMQERVAALGGTVSVSSQPAEGFELRVALAATGRPA